MNVQPVILLNQGEHARGKAAFIRMGLSTRCVVMDNNTICPPEHREETSLSHYIGPVLVEMRLERFKN